MRAFSHTEIVIRIRVVIVSQSASSHTGIIGRRAVKSIRAFSDTGLISEKRKSAIGAKFDTSAVDC